MAIASVILTLLILFLSEIIPKTLGAMYWRRLTGFIAVVLPPLILILLPLVWLSEAITGFMRRRRTTETFSREEFAALARVGEEQGVFDEFLAKADEEIAAQEAEIAEVSKGRDDLLEGVPVELIEEYDRLFESRDGLAVCEAESQYCQGEE